MWLLSQEIFTATLHDQQKHVCAGEAREPWPKEECPCCHKMLSRGPCLIIKSMDVCPGCHGTFSRCTVYSNKRFRCPRPKPIGERKECFGRAPKRFVRSVVKNPENCQAPAKDVDVHSLVPYPVYSPSKEEVEALGALLASVPQPTDYEMVPLKTDQVTPTDPPPIPSQTEPPTPPSPTLREVICPFHPASELRRRISAKGWDYIKCPE